MHKIILFFAATLILFLYGFTNLFAAKTYKIEKNFICYQVKSKPHKIKSKRVKTQGLASWYGRDFQSKRTSSGERYNMYRLTAAHKTLPLSSYALVTNLSNSRQVIVKVNDRGPFIGHRIIDLSYAAAKEIGMVHRGVARVSVEPVSCRPSVTL